MINKIAFFSIVISFFGAGSAIAETTKIEAAIIKSADEPRVILSDYGELILDNSEIDIIGLGDSGLTEKTDEKIATDREKALRPEKGPGRLNSWPFKLTADQIVALMKIGVKFSYLDRILADSMQKRGFSSEQYVNAYLDLMSIGISPELASEFHPEKFSKEGYVSSSYLNLMATFRHLGFPVQQFKDLVESGYSLSSYYNDTLGGRDKKIAGWTLFAITTILAFSSLEFVVAVGQGAADCPDQNEKQQERCRESFARSDMYIISAFTGFSAVGLTFWLPLGIWGTIEASRHVWEGFLESAKIEELEPYREQLMWKLGFTEGMAGLSPTERKVSSGVKPEVELAPMGFRVRF